MITEEQVYTVKDIATIMKITRNTTNALIKSHPFSVNKIGDTYRVSKEVFDKCLTHTLTY